MQLKDKRIIVTGGARGIGNSVVRAYLAEGARVSVLDFREEEGRAAVAEANQRYPGAAQFVVCDVSDMASVQLAFGTAVAHLGGLDVLVHAAAIAPNVMADQITLAQWEEMFAVNTRGTFLTNRAAFEVMRLQQAGRIINFASGAGVKGLPGKAHYAASKGAVLAWTRTVAHEWGPTGITVNAVAPAIWTPMYDATRASMSPESLKAHDAAMARQIPLGGKLGDADNDLAPVLVFLASDNSRFITGQTLPVDGGMLMMS
ncbi:SDR family NAD(P)-dependent oxidoreductase [Paraburkholderia saeva]|uniref:SDR family NAD(P)-dependent oxidoreductase n=1 Tax=Paraburkholderia saeva TaxID=2777537 RepID=UPI001D40D4C6|nr:SDR family NAD(P)-dependent oxidoreductase [Paraburkholderia saeva]CAG4895528.1 Dihydroanticapsin 7-dehydrogenase [Paraburkholderia saeva]